MTLLNQNNTADGNDFGVDDIIFTPLTDCSVMDSIRVMVSGYPDNVDSADCVFFPEGTEWGIGQPLISSAGAITVSTPMVGDIDDDGQQEIVCLAGSSSISSTINIFNADATLKSQFSTNGFYIWNSIGLAKVKWQENEYKNIIVVLGTNKRLYAYDAQGTQLWQSNTTFPVNESMPLPAISFADFNHDGWTEIYIGGDIYDAATGVLLCRASGNKGYSGRTWNTQNNVYHTVSADLCGDYTLELAAGNTVYSVDIQSRTDFNANQMAVVREVPSSAMKMEDNTSIPFSDGNTYLADMNLDGRLDVLVMNVDQSNRVLYLYVWDVETQSIICSKKIGNTRKFGTPQIGDINQDGYDEICFITGTYSAHSTGSNDLIYALQYNPQNNNGALDVFWTTPHSDNSACTGLTLFDFNQDGIAELVYRDRFNLRIINGSLIHHQTGQALTQPYDMAVSPCGSATGIEYPLVVDVDLDGEAEIVVGGAAIETDFGHLYIFNSSGEPWAPARKVWNQYMYNVTNVNEDLTIPQYLFNNATAFTGPEGVVRRPFNNFLQQATTIDHYGRPFYAVPDVAMGASASLQMTGDTLTLTFPYCNNGDNTLNAPYIITVFANTYGGDTVCTVTMDESLPVDSCTLSEIQLPISMLCGFQNLDSLVVAVNCAGTGIAQNGGLQPECDTTNNTAAVAVTLHADTTHLIATACDSYMWYGDTLTQSGEFTYIQVNPDGCDSVMILHLRVKPSSDSTLFATVVENNLPYILNDSSYMFSGVYDQHFINAVNCDSTLTLHLTVYHNQTYEVDSTVCEDALPFTWNDSVFASAGTKTRIYLAANGADSIVVMTLHVNPLPMAAISGPTVLCGDSVVTLTADSAYTYLWSTGDTTRSIAVTEKGIYTLTVTNEFGCEAVATHPLMPLGNPILSVSVPTMCAGGSYNLSVGYQPGDNIHLGHGETTLSMTDTIFLPDGIYCEPYGCSYRSPLTFTAYADGDTIQSVEDIYYVKLNIEHSWIGDLYINITCPNGQKADLMKYGGSGTSDCSEQIVQSSRGWAAGSNMPYSTYLGDAYDYNVGSCDASAFGNEPGVGWNYCWSENTSQGYIYASGTGGYIYRLGNTHNNIVDSSNVSAGTQFYHPDDSFSNLIGCPLNGDWYIEVQDGWSGDNGYIFGWELALSSEALPDMEYELDYSTVEGPWVTTLSDTLFQITPPEGLEHDTTVAYTFTVYDTTGCGYDTTVNITFYAVRHTEVDTAVCESYTWNGSVYTESGQYEQTFTSAVGCDSIVTLHLTVNHKTYGDTTVVACESYTWHGVEYTSTPATAPTYTMTGGNHNGCDSIVTLHLTVNQMTYGDTTVVVCEHFTWHGVDYTETPAAAPTYTMPGGNHSGCDSIVTLHLTVNHKTYGDTTVVACEHFTWHGFDYTATPAVAPTYTMIGGNHSGCDSIVTLHLTVNHGTHDVSEETACEGYEWHGTTYAVSDTYTYTYTDANGCSSVDTLHLTVYYGTHNVTDTIVCENFEWNGTIYTESGTYTYAYTNADDCPSTDTLHLTVAPVYEFSFEDVICEGEVYNDHGFVVPSSQTVGVPDVSLTQSLQSQSGCDSLVHLTLTVIDTSLRIIPLSEDFCESSSMELMVETTMEDYVWSTGEDAPTITVMQAGIYSVTATQGGCQATSHFNVVECHYELYLPNAITPSRGDGMNDYFSIPEVNRANMVMFEIAIYNRWGELVFHSTDKNFMWNGECRGQIYYETIYNYVIHYTDTAGKPYVRTGSITIL